MANYTVLSGQNLYDVALHLYGSIEGITDLLICNPELSMAAELTQGQRLVYSDDYVIDPEIVAYNRMNGIVPANGERSVYFKESQYPRLVEIRVPSPATYAGMSLRGRGVMEVDWCDNTPLQLIELNDSLSYHYHFFDNRICGQRKIRLYGDFTLRRADWSELDPETIFVMRPLHVEELILKNCRAPLGFLEMTEGLYSLDHTGLKTAGLLPIAQCRSLRTLDLSEMDVPKENLDLLLKTLVAEHYGRKPCSVTLTQPPSGEYREPERDGELNYFVTGGMEAVWLLTREPSWNAGGSWIFDICGSIYTFGG